MKIFKTFLLFFILYASHSWGYSDFYQQHRRGWYWYEQSETVLNKNDEASMHTQRTATEALQSFQKEFEEAKAEMVMHPSLDSTRKYIKYQRQLFQKADEVSKYWREAMLVYPELDIARGLPSSAEGARILDQQKHDLKQKVLKNFADDFKLLFFYKKSCPYCARFAKVLKIFANRYGFKVAAVTLDGGVLEEFPVRFDQKLIEKLHRLSIKNISKFTWNNRSKKLINFASVAQLDRAPDFGSGG